MDHRAAKFVEEQVFCLTQPEGEDEANFESQREKLHTRALKVYEGYATASQGDVDTTTANIANNPGWMKVTETPAFKLPVTQNGEPTGLEVSLRRVTIAPLDPDADDFEPWSVRIDFIVGHAGSDDEGVLSVDKHRGDDWDTTAGVDLTVPGVDMVQSFEEISQTTGLLAGLERDLGLIPETL